MDSTAADQAQSLVTFLIREPVQEAVRAELRDERNADTSEQRSTSAESTDSGGLLSTLAVLGLVVGVVGLGYAVRRRMTHRSTDPAELENRVTVASGDTDGDARSVSSSN